MRRIAIPVAGLTAQAELVVHDAGASASAALLVMPGGRCAARRYDWLAPLTAHGIIMCILDGALSVPVEQDGPSPAILQLAAALDVMAAWQVSVHGLGHSAGAAALLDALDPGANAAAKLPHDFALPIALASVTSLGCSLQPRTLDWVLPHRSEDRPLRHPEGTRLLFLTGEEDAVAPSALVGRTCARFTPPAPMIVMRQATHYGWAGPREEGDFAQSDADPALCTTDQRARTLTYLAAFLAGHPVTLATGDQLIAPDN